MKILDLFIKRWEGKKLHPQPHGGHQGDCLSCVESSHQKGEFLFFEGDELYGQTCVMTIMAPEAGLKPKYQGTEMYHHSCWRWEKE